MNYRVLVVAEARHLHALSFLREAVQHPGFAWTVLDTHPAVEAYPDNPFGLVRVVPWEGQHSTRGSLPGALVRFARFARELLAEADVVLLYYVRPFHAGLQAAARRAGVPVVLAFWGSDYVQTRGWRRWLVDAQCRTAAGIICGEPKLQAHLAALGLASGEPAVCYFGTATGAVLAERERDRTLALRSGPTSPTGLLRPLRIVIGNNASERQAHLPVLESLAAALPSADRAQVHVTVPMSYGGDPDYVHTVAEALEAGGWSYRLVRDFLPAEALADLREGTDVYVNVQPTDAYSGSMRETMFLGGHVVYGDWLDYAFVDYPSTRFHPVASVAAVGATVAAMLDGILPVLPGHVHATFARTLSWRVTVPDWLDALARAT